MKYNYRVMYDAFQVGDDYYLLDEGMIRKVDSEDENGEMMMDLGDFEFNKIYSLVIDKFYDDDRYLFKYEKGFLKIYAIQNDEFTDLMSILANETACMFNVGTSLDNFTDIVNLLQENAILPYESVSSDD